MSKQSKDKLNSSVTLFNYFSRSPATPKLKPSSSNPGTPVAANDSKTGNGTPKSIKKETTTPRSNAKVSERKEDDDREEEIAPMKKRRRIVIDESSDDSETENKAKNDKTPPKLSSFERLDKNRTDSPMQKRIKLEEDNCAKAVPEPKQLAEDEEDPATSTLDEPTIWAHQKLDFLKPGKIKDIQGNKPGSEKYDARTLYVPESFLNTVTPAMRQWWELKCRHMDCVLFFKVGKFYELYHMDATVGVTELGFSYMKGEFAHSGFPEKAYERMATVLVEKGYKVARVEQTETPEMMQERCRKTKSNSKYDKVTKREICQVTQLGTEVFGQQVRLTLNHQPKFMLAITERGKAGVCDRYGVCFIDTSLGVFHVGEFDDDNQASRLLTLLSHYTPCLVLHERSLSSPGIQQVFKTVLAGTRKEALTNESQFWKAEKTLKYLAEHFYGSPSEDKTSKWPAVIRCMMDANDHLGLTPDDRFQLALKALGGCVWYLKRCLLDQQIISLASFELYVPPDDTTTRRGIEIANTNRFMVLDAITLNNLRVVEGEQSLVSKMDHCCTMFGKRLLHHWICSPSCEREVIVERQDAVTELLYGISLLQDVRQVLGELPDLERMLAQIHTFGNAERSKNHPDGRAILYEEHIYGKKKIQDFINTLRGFRALTKLPELCKGVTCKLLIRLTQTANDGGSFPDMNAKIRFFEESFDHEAALEKGIIAPGPGLDEEYDAVQQEIREIEEELEKYKRAQEKYFGCKISYFGTDKKRFQLEIPEDAAKKAKSSYSLEGQKKGKNGVKRYHTEETRDFLKRMMQAEDKRKVVLKGLSRRIFEKFSGDYELWKTCIDLTGMVDVLTSFAEYARSGGDMCVPVILDDSEGQIFELEEGTHPCVSDRDNYIPNGVKLGTENSRMILLTGPNMGGKSTLMRQVGILAAMAQIGSLIPAQSCRMTLIDRIFTRLGANDDIMAGHSTFLVELNETSTILRHATERSLVLLDELGRGTATYDGTAIAGAVVDFLATMKCRSMFSTHYHNLVDNFAGDGRISLGHMACMVENDDDDDPTQETVTFLYKYADGACPKSYGFNAAKLAGMPASIIKRAHELSKSVEVEALKRKIFTKSLQRADDNEVKDLLRKIKACRF
ncbi:probable DNA mismatch repair protein Msh6 [Toxorhynchites rutilus septentrionalis]|uniref:probable DNA mismatch repair protein Msh6 n=1 Tax=Toxorhynchites rutilus septentrionalis TaxID=329112 RepID=UPI00247A5FA7|nr:probable DNA mismatch repair protein Msh6 [Toxorhynchites rutilus septentrionalis]